MMVFSEKKKRENNGGDFNTGEHKCKMGYKVFKLFKE